MESVVNFLRSLLPSTQKPRLTPLSLVDGELQEKPQSTYYYKKDDVLSLPSKEQMGKTHRQGNALALGVATALSVALRRMRRGWRVAAVPLVLFAVSEGREIATASRVITEVVYNGIDKVTLRYGLLWNNEITVPVSSIKAGFEEENSGNKKMARVYAGDKSFYLFDTDFLETSYLMENRNLVHSILNGDVDETLRFKKVNNENSSLAI